MMRGNRVTERANALLYTLCIAAFVNVILVNFALSFVSKLPFRDSGLGQTREFLRRHAGDDSWGPMNDADRYLSSKQPQPLYKAIFFDRKRKFQYPPTSLLVLAAPLPVLKAISWVFVLVTPMFVIKIFRRSLLQTGPGDAPAWRSAPGLLLAALLTLFSLTYYPLIKGYALGQIQVWINALFAMAFWCWMDRRQRTCGFLIGVICLIKPQYGVLLLWGVLRRSWGFALTFAGTCLAGLAVSVFHYGWENHLDYLSVLSFISRHGEAFYPNQSVNGLLNRLLRNGNNLEWLTNEFAPFHPWVYAGTMVSSVALLMLALRRGRNVATAAGLADFALVSLASTMASPVAWEHHYGILLPLYAFLVPVVWQDKPNRKWRLGAVAISYLLTSNFWEPLNRLADTPVNFLQSYLFAGGLIVLVYLWRERKGKAAGPVAMPSGREEEAMIPYAGLAAGSVQKRAS